MVKAGIFFANGFEECEGLLIVDLFRRAGIEMQTISIAGERAVTSSHNVTVMTDLLFGEACFGEMDIIILPGGMPGTTNLGNHQGVKEVVSDFYQQGKRIAAICAAPSVFGQLGLLKGKKATCYPSFEEQLEGAIVTGEPVVVDGNITTGSGLGAAIPFALELISQLIDPNTAERIKTAIKY